MPTAFEPDGWEVERHDDAQIRLTLQSDSRGDLPVILPRSSIPGLIARLVAEIGPGQGVPIAQSSFRSDQTILVQAFAARRHRDGSASLTISAHLPDQTRDVTIPLELTPKNVKELITML